MLQAESRVFFFSSRRRHTRYIGDWSSDVCSSDLVEPARRDVALEDVAEADEEARPDHADDLALVGLVPTALIELPLEEPREAELVRAVLDLGGGALEQRGVLGEGVQILGRRIVGGAELAKQR